MGCYCINLILELVAQQQKEGEEMRKGGTKGQQISRGVIVSCWDSLSHSEFRRDSFFLPPPSHHPFCFCYFLINKAT